MYVATCLQHPPLETLWSKGCCLTVLISTLNSVRDPALLACHALPSQTVAPADTEWGAMKLIEG